MAKRDAKGRFVKKQPSNLQTDVQQAIDAKRIEREKRIAAREDADDWAEPAVTEKDLEVGNGCAIACAFVILGVVFLLMCIAFVSWRGCTEIR